MTRLLLSLGLDHVLLALSTISSRDPDLPKLVNLLGWSRGAWLWCLAADAAVLFCLVVHHAGSGTNEFFVNDGDSVLNTKCLKSVLL